MASKGIRDRVAIVGMGCTAFGERWDKSASDLLIDAANDAYASAKVDPEQIDAYWLGTTGSGVSGLTLSLPLKIQYKPVTRLENMCATGSEALRNACYAVASGAYDLVMAIGVEKLKDSGFSGLTGNAPPNDNPNALGVFTFNLRFPGQTYDKEAGLSYNHHRDYRAQSGRYAESDPIGLAGGINTYGYAAANPLSYSDSLGLTAGVIPVPPIRLPGFPIIPNWLLLPLMLITSW